MFIVCDKPCFRPCPVRPSLSFHSFHFLSFFLFLCLPPRRIFFLQEGFLTFCWSTFSVLYRSLFDLLIPICLLILVPLRPPLNIFKVEFASATEAQGSIAPSQRASCEKGETKISITHSHRRECCKCHWLRHIGKQHRNIMLPSLFLRVVACKQTKGSTSEPSKECKRPNLGTIQ